MIIDQLPTVSLPVQNTDELPIERGTQTYKVSVGDSFVKKSGDVMSGRLAVANNQPYVVIKNTEADTARATDTENREGNLYFYDQNDKLMGFVQTIFTTAGQQRLYLAARRQVNGVNAQNLMNLAVNADGSQQVTVSSPQAWRSALGLGSSGAFPLTVAQGGTGAITAAAALTNLGAASYSEGTWTPKLYDNNTFKQDLASQVYYKIGKFYVMFIYLAAFPNTTFSTMIQIRNCPCSQVIGGSVYCAAASGVGQGGSWTIQGGSGTVFLRPNYTGTLSGGMFQMVIFGHD